MIYDIKLRIAYDYAAPAEGGRHVVCMMPLDLGAAQNVQRATLAIHPVADERVDRRDFFGNHLTEFSFHAPHRSMAVMMHAQVTRTALPDRTAPGCRVGDLPRILAGWRDIGPASPLHFHSPSQRAPLHPAMTAFATALIAREMRVQDAVMRVGQALFRRMRFDANSTTVDTPAAEAFEKRHGVCQDFSHIMISSLRGIGIPAGYVSGFLRTLPPPGKPRLEGADAMHAWVRAWCGADLGWLEFDPTNNCTVSADHVVVAYGRDYSDVSPIKGTMRIAGGQKSRQSVDMIEV